MKSLAVGRKYIVGWISLKQGSEEKFDAILEPYLEACRMEPECRFFEMIRTPKNPQTVFICESFLSAQAHEVHKKRPHVIAFFAELHKLAISGTFENISSGEVNSDTHDFLQPMSEL